MQKNKSKYIIAAIIIVVAMMLLTPLYSAWTPSSTHSGTAKATSISNTGFAGSTVVAPSASSIGTAVPVSAASWTQPTTTMQEPGYTNGTYPVATVINIGHMNIFLQTSLYAALMTNEIYDSPLAELPNGTYVPWLATSWSETNTSAPSNHTTFDPLTGTWENYSYIWTVHIRPGVQWTDWNTTNSADAYTYSNYTSFNNTTGVHFTHTSKLFSSMQMNTHTVQASDFVLSWKIMSQSQDFSGNYVGIVNVIPVNNLTVEYLLSSQSATFVTYTLGSPILPYHIWSSHDFANNEGYWNYTASGAAGMGYDTWELGYNPSTGFAPSYVGDGPYMMSGYGMPHGYQIAYDGWQLYANPHYWVQYTNASTNYRQYTPKIYSLKYIYYSTISSAVAAMSKGQVATITEGVDPSFVPIVSTMPNTYIYHKPSSGYGYMQFNSSASNAPFNITAFRQALNYATNKQYLASVVDSGYTILGQPLIPPSDPLWRNASTPSYTYNPSKAISLIKAIPGMVNNSGEWYYNGTPVTADIQITSAGPNPLGVEGALLIAQWWGQIGVPTTVTQEAFTTLLANLVLYNFNTISLGITGIAGDPTGDYFDFYNSVIGAGTGFYLGPFSDMTYGGKFYTGAQVTSLMDNLTLELNSNTNLTQRIAISAELQGIAAIQSTMICLGYPVDILPFSNGTYVNISTTNTQPYAGYMWWAGMTVHKRTTAISVSFTSHLIVNVTTNAFTYTNSQSGTVTIKVTNNATGNAVSGASVTVAATPAGALLNSTSLQGTTNSNGEFTVSFSVLNTQPLIYTSGYSGAINFTAAASVTTSSVQSAIGYTHINVLPLAVKLVTSPTPTLVNGSAKQLYWIKVEDSSGNPISGFRYTVQTMSGAVIMQTAMSGETISNTTTYNPFFGPYFTVNNTKNFNDYNVTQITGTTGTNGTIYVWISANTTFNFNSAGQLAGSYIFFGSIAAGTPVNGVANYMIPGEMTSNLNSNGFGLQQPLEFPVQLSNSSTPAVKIALSVSSNTVAYNGSVTVTVKVTNTATGDPIPYYTVYLMAQNDLGANRGFFVNGSGMQTILAPNPNYVFGSEILPGINVTTNAAGQATVTFLPNFYIVYYAPIPVTALYAYPNGAHDLVPFDMFTITAIGVNSDSSTPLNSTIVYSTASNYVAPPAKGLSVVDYTIIGVVIAAVIIVAVAAVVIRSRSQKKSKS